MRKAATLPYEIVEFDGHKLDVHLTLRIDDPFGFETLLILHRIWILVPLDVASRAVGYALAPGREYNGDDVAQALQALLMPHVTREPVIPSPAGATRWRLPVGIDTADRMGLLEHAAVRRGEGASREGDAGAPHDGGRLRH